MNKLPHAPIGAAARIVAVIPALDEESNVGWVIRRLRPHVDDVVLVDNGSRDRTAQNATEAGAVVVHEPKRGYGAACHAGIARARELGATCVLFLDADGSDDPDEAPLLTQPILDDSADLVLGVRRRQAIEPGAMTRSQRFGNWLAPLLMRLVSGAPYSDMPPFKAIRSSALDRLALTEQTYGFTIELLLKSHTQGLRVLERQVHCRARMSGQSKVSGSLSSAARAGVRIIAAIARHAR